jgi:hypothetical protein
MDEKGFLIGVMGKTKRVFNRNEYTRGKLLGAGHDGSRTWITLVGCICQDMTTLPPFLIYPGVAGNFQDSWLEDFDPESQEAYFSTSPSGWTNDELGKIWLEKVFNRYTKEKARKGRDYRLLLIDGHGSHINMSFLDFCERHRILIAVFPPHSTHRLQPLDVSLFSPLATAYTRELDNWIQKTRGLSRLSKREFFGIFWAVFPSTFSTSNLQSAWRKTGLLPWNPEVVYTQIRPNKPNSRPGSSSNSNPLSLPNPSSREIRRLLDRTIENKEDPDAQLLMKTMESLQAKVELLQHEVKGYQAAAQVEKRKKQVGRPVKDFLFDDDGEKIIVFSPSKVQRARDKKAELQTQQEEEKAQRETARIEREKKKGRKKKKFVKEKKLPRKKKDNLKRLGRTKKEKKQLEFFKSKRISS